MTKGTVVAISLPSGAVASLRVRNEHSQRWQGDPPARTYGAKPTVNYQGFGVFPEVAAVGLLNAEGWGACWESTYGGLRFFSEQPAATRSHCHTSCTAA